MRCDNISYPLGLDINIPNFFLLIYGANETEVKFILNNLQNLRERSIFWCLPFSIIKQWLEHRKFEIIFFCIKRVGLSLSNMLFLKLI